MSIPVMEPASTPPSLSLLSRKYGFRVIEQNGRLRLVPLRWSAYTWTLLVVFALMCFFVYKGQQIDVPWQKAVLVGSCTLLAVALLFGILTRFVDGVTVTADRITYRYGTVRRSVPTNAGVEVQVRQNIHRWTNDGEQRVRVTAELWLIHPSRKYHLLDFHGHSEEDAVPMHELGERLKASIQAYIM